MVDISIEITLKGEYTHTEAEAFAFKLGALIVNSIKEKVRKMNLVSDGGGEFLQGWDFRTTKKGLTIFNSQEYADYLEYGTFAYFDSFGLDSFPETPDPKKKDLDAEARKAFPRGMQPFAPVRRVVYNESVMARLVALALPR